MVEFRTLLIETRLPTAVVLVSVEPGRRPDRVEAESWPPRPPLGSDNLAGPAERDVEFCDSMYYYA
jgi:hypothetical protein